MTRTTAATLALVGLLLLTGLTAWLADASATPLVLAGVGLAKIAVVGAVFLELDRAWWGWALSAGILVLVVLGGAAGLTLGGS